MQLSNVSQIALLLATATGLASAKSGSDAFEVDSIRKLPGWDISGLPLIAGDCGLVAGYDALEENTVISCHLNNSIVSNHTTVGIISFHEENNADEEDEILPEGLARLNSTRKPVQENLYVVYAWTLERNVTGGEGVELPEQMGHYITKHFSRTASSVGSFDIGLGDTKLFVSWVPRAGGKVIPVSYEAIETATDRLVKSLKEDGATEGLILFKNLASWDVCMQFGPLDRQVRCPQDESFSVKLAGFERPSTTFWQTLKNAVETVLAIW